MRLRRSGCLPMVVNVKLARVDGGLEEDMGRTEIQRTRLGKQNVSVRYSLSSITSASASNPAPFVPLRRSFFGLTITVLLLAVRFGWRARFRSRSGRWDLAFVPTSRGALVFGGTKAADISSSVMR